MTKHSIQVLLCTLILSYFSPAQTNEAVFYVSKVGRDNLVQNNIFVECHPSVNIYIWPHKAYFHPGGPWDA